jgi:hypothetical protein
MVARETGCTQDGMLAYYLAQAKTADSNVEARIERKPFDYRAHLMAGLSKSGLSKESSKAIQEVLGAV